MATEELLDEDTTIEGELVTTDPAEFGALMAITRGEIDTQIATAKRYPRSLVNFKKQALEFATIDEETAQSMFYVLPRAGKKIEGPSVRLAEVVGSCWGNLRYGARIVATEDNFIVAQGTCADLEKNVAAAVEVRRRITDRKGNRYNDDMIGVTSNAACAVALRQAIFKVVPFAFVKQVYEQAKLTSLGKAQSMAERRDKMVGWFAKIGVSEAQVLACIERKGVEEISLDDLIVLKGLATAIKDGEATIESVFVPRAAEGRKATPSALADKLATKTRPAKAPAQMAPGEVPLDTPDEPESDAPDAPPTLDPATDAHSDDAIRAEIAAATTRSAVHEINNHHMRDDVRRWCDARLAELDAASAAKPASKGKQKTAFDNTPEGIGQ